jgi:large subunit ribosomal protein L30
MERGSDERAPASERLNATGKMAQLRIRQIRSAIGGKQNQRDTLRTLGLKRLHDEVVREDRPEVRGMVATVAHLVTVEEVDQ